VFAQRLNDLRGAVSGALAACLAAGDGISIESVGGEDLDLEVLAAEMVSMAQGIGTEQRGLRIGETTRFEVVTEAYALVLTRVREGYYLLLVVEAGHPLGRARFEMRRAALDFQDDLI
jgi:predicted regulator of Ras-like GTPase activity (Roadblock/LC7/MglB family)